LEITNAIYPWLGQRVWVGLKLEPPGKDDALRVGISLTSNHPDVKDPRQGARWMIERAATARRAGLDSLFVGDQHVSPTPYYQNTPMLGRLLAEWGGARFAAIGPIFGPVLLFLRSSRHCRAPTGG